MTRSPVLHWHSAERKDFKAAWHSLECICASGVWIIPEFPLIQGGVRKYTMHSHLDVIHADYHCMAQDDKGAFAALVD